jgi:hypothetical protein
MVKSFLTTPRVPFCLHCMHQRGASQWLKARAVLTLKFPLVVCACSSRLTARWVLASEQSHFFVNLRCPSPATSARRVTVHVLRFDTLLRYWSTVCTSVTSRMQTVCNVFEFVTRRYLICTRSHPWLTMAVPLAFSDSSKWARLGLESSTSIQPTWSVILVYETDSLFAKPNAPSTTK